MNIDPRIKALHNEMTAWRHDIHRHPETAFEETRTAAFVAAKLAEFGAEVHTGLARTGVVGTIVGKRDRGRAIALRADMDALHLEERNDFPHRSVHAGKMHGCGHDGHTTMLLAAAKVLAERRDFDGRVHVIFQPAEENEGGGRAMVEEGLFERFPVEGVYGLHNYPRLPLGHFAVRPGPMMASYDIFELTLKGKGAHGGLPHEGIDPVVMSAQVVLGLQTIASRIIDPIDSIVVSVTQIEGGATWNVIPDEVRLRGTVRALQPAARDAVEPLIRRIAESICAAQGGSLAMRYERRYPPVVNHARETEVAAAAAHRISGAGGVDAACRPIMASEDFAFMLNARPGAYLLVGNGETAPVHNPHYDFNDALLPIGASYWLALVETLLGPNAVSGGTRGGAAG
jgi:amidohydrolase